MKLLKIKTILITTCITFLGTIAYSQAKKPTIMVVPHDTWMTQHGYMKTYDNQGVDGYAPDYRKALVENAELNYAIDKVNDMMMERGFTPEILADALKTLEAETAEDALRTSKDGFSEISETPLDALARVAKADIWLQLMYEVKQTGPKKYVVFTIKGVDAYTNKLCASSQGAGSPSFTQEETILLEEAVLAHIDNFNADLMTYFQDLFTKGREVKIRILTWDSWGYDLETEEFGDDELSLLIEDWVADNTVEGRFGSPSGSETRMEFKQVRIPLYYDRKGIQKPLDTYRWLSGLKKYLKEIGVPSTTKRKGLGEAILIIGQ